MYVKHSLHVIIAAIKTESNISESLELAGSWDYHLVQPCSFKDEQF